LALDLLSVHCLSSGGEMKSNIRMLFLFLWAGSILAQGISVKTVPLLSTDQFSLVPSFRDDMGGTSIAIRDGLQDLFINPGHFAPETRSQWFVNPRLSHWGFSQETSTRYNGQWPSYNLEQNNAKSSIFTLPIGFLFTSKNVYTAAMAGFQALSAGNWQSAHFKASNYPWTWIGGLYLPRLKTAIGVGVDYVRIRGIDGVYLLYPNATQLSQKGSARQFRLGLCSSLANGDHWNLSGSRYLFKILQTEQNVVNKDENNGWWVQANYMKKISEPLTLAALIVADWRHHPKIPEYPLAGIPRDPGNTRALNFGFGLKWQNETTLFGIDLIYEPVDVKTWADAATEFTNWDGHIYRVGDVTQRNDYRFANRLIRSGVQIKPTKWLSLATGAQVKLYEYDYYQNDFLNHAERTGKPQRQWSETTWTGGIKIHTGKIILTYSLRLQTGTGLLERQWLWRWFAFDGLAEFAKADFLIPPTVTLNVTPVTYYTQWLGLTYCF